MSRRFDPNQQQLENAVRPLVEFLEQRFLLSFSVNERVVTVGDTACRASGSTSGTLYDTIPAGKYGTVQARGADNGGFEWYRVDWDNYSYPLTDGWSAGGSPRFVAAILPAAPVMTYPTSGTTLTTLTPTMTWNGSSGATGYGLYVKDTASNTLVYDNDNVANVTSLALPGGTLAWGKNYTWNMRAKNGAGWSAFSPSVAFSTQTAQPAKPVTIGPGTTSDPGPVESDLTPTFSWNSVAGATHYKLNLLNRDSGVYVLNDFQVNGASTTSYTLTSNLPAGARFVWDMRAFNGTVASPFADNRYFQTQAAQPAKPVSIGPGSTSSPGPVESDMTPTFQWNAVPNATRYELNLLNQDTGQYVLDELQINGGSTTSYTLTSNLPTGARFVWDMRAFNGNVASDYADNRYFQTQVAQPSKPVTVGPGTTTDPGSVESDLTPTFSWNAVAGATHYKLNLLNRDTAVYVLDDFQVNGGSTTSYTLTSNLPTGTRFVWDMRAFNDTLASDFADNRYFQTQATVTSLFNGLPVTGLSDGIGGQRFFKLTVPAGASNLKFQITGSSGDADIYVKFGSSYNRKLWMMTAQ